jgi:hypothetical protein
VDAKLSRVIPIAKAKTCVYIDTAADGGLLLTSIHSCLFKGYLLTGNGRIGLQRFLPCLRRLYKNVSLLLQFR